MMTAVSTSSLAKHSSVFCNLASALSISRDCCLSRPLASAAFLSNPKLYSGLLFLADFLATFGNDHLLFLQFSPLSLGHMHHESGSCLGFEHHHPHHILSTSPRPCIQQVCNKYLLNELSPPPCSYFSVYAFSSAGHPLPWMFLSAQPLPFCPSLCQHTHTPFPHSTSDVPAPHVVPSPTVPQSFGEAIPWMAPHRFRVRACLNLSAPPSQQLLYFSGVFDCQFSLIPLSSL